jgi:hypothetical protein
MSWRPIVASVLAVVVIAGVLVFLYQLKGGIDRGVRIKQAGQPEEILQRPRVEEEPSQPPERLPPPRVEEPVDQSSSGR